MERWRPGDRIRRVGHASSSWREEWGMYQGGIYKVLSSQRSGSVVITNPDDSHGFNSDMFELVSRAKTIERPVIAETVMSGGVIL